MHHSKRNPHHSNYLFGTRAVIEAIDADKEIEKVLVQKNVKNELIAELLTKLKAHHIPFTRVPMEGLNRITRKNHQGVIAFISPIRYHSLDNLIQTAYQEGRDPFLVILDRVTDVRNFGAIARTVECVGSDGLVIQSKGNALIGADAIMTSAGALNRVPVCREDNLKEAITELRSSGIRIVGCTEKSDQDLYETELDGPVAIIMGSEEDGISPEYLKLCDEKVKIPMKGQIASLNVSVSAGIVLYEILRQRSQN